jgi:hypothetical protein
MKKRIFFTAGILVYLNVFSPLNLHAQGGPDESVPIDGGASLLAAAGVAYGAKRLYESRRKKEGQEID